MTTLLHGSIFQRGINITLNKRYEQERRDSFREIFPVVLSLRSRGRGVAISVARNRARERFTLSESRRIRRWIDLNAAVESRRGGGRRVFSAPAESTGGRGRGREREEKEVSPLTHYKRTLVRAAAPLPPSLFPCCCGCCRCWLLVQAAYLRLHNIAKSIIAPLLIG